MKTDTNLHSVRHNQVPSLSQQVKDHKETLKTRPVCRARADQAPNGPLAALVGDILDPFIRKADRGRRTEVISTEELCPAPRSCAMKLRLSMKGSKRTASRLDPFKKTDI